MSAGRETLQRALGPSLLCFVTSVLTPAATWSHTGTLPRVAHKAVVSQKKECSGKYKYLRGLCPSSGAEGGSVLPTGISGLGSQGMWERVVLMAWTVHSCPPLPQNLLHGPHLGEETRRVGSVARHPQGEAFLALQLPVQPRLTMPFTSDPF